MLQTLIIFLYAKKQRVRASKKQGSTNNKRLKNRRFQPLLLLEGVALYAIIRHIILAHVKSAEASANGHVALHPYGVLL